MKSLDTLLAEAVTKMKSATRLKFAERTNGKKLAQENLVNIAESMLAADGEDIRESRPIRRNNSGQAVEESGYSMEKADEMLFSALAEARPQAFKKKDEVRETADGLTPKQREDFEFGKLIGLSESEALKVAKSGDIRG